jgi:MFS family permease
MSDVALQMRGPVGGTTDARKVAIGSSVGAVIETYDFIGFGTAAALYFGTAFFPSSNPVTGTLAAFATLGVGFAARPLGGIIGGHLGDRVGRKPVLVASLIVMGLATFVIGLLPTYATVGVVAPVLLVIVRIIQGLAFGAEWGGAILMAYEHAPWRAKGRFTGIVQAGFPVGLLLANLVFLFSVHLGGSLAWRIPFLSSIVLVVVGLIIRSKVPESPVFEEVKESGTVAKSPILDSIRYDWRNILRGICLRVAETAGYAVSITYMISYLNTNHLTTRTQTLLSLCLAAAIGIGATLAWGRLTDRIGRRPQYVVVCAFGIVWGVLMFTLVNTGAFVVIMLTLVISYTVSQNALAGAQGGWFPELFTAARRASGASMAYQISAMVSGFTPFITTLLYVKFGWAGPALLFSCYALIGLIAALATRETYGRRERRLAAEASASAAPVHVSVDHPLPETSELQTPPSQTQQFDTPHSQTQQFDRKDAS